MYLWFTHQLLDQNIFITRKRRKTATQQNILSTEGTSYEHKWELNFQSFPYVENTTLWAVVVKLETQF